MHSTDVEPQDDTRGAPTAGSPESAWANSSTDFTKQVSPGSRASDSSCAYSEGGLQRGRPSTANAVMAGFFKSAHGSKIDVNSLSTRERMRYRLITILQSSYFDTLIGCVMLFDVFLMISDVDARGSLKQLPTWMEVASNVCLAFYTVEFSLAFFVHGVAMFRRRVVQVDAFVLSTGYSEVLLALAGADVQQMGILRAVRIIRMMRLIRTARNSPILKELRKLVMMLASCLKILLWSSIFLMIVQTFWGMMAVEFLQPVMRDLIEDGFWSDCELCQTAFSSVARANLTLFKTIVAGDSWGVIAEPMIIEHPWVSILFALSFLSLVFGVMNLVVAVVVDTAAEQRQKDVMSLARDLEEEQGADLQELTEIFRKIDEDGSGELELDELIKGAEEVPEFQSRLRVMDIDRNDLIQLFEMLDEDGGGSISPEEFVHALNRWIYDSKTATRFVKYNVMKLSEEQKSLADSIRNMSKKMERSMERMTKLSRKQASDSRTQRSTNQLLRPVAGASVSEGSLVHISEEEAVSPGYPKDNEENATINSHLNTKVSFSQDNIRSRRDLCRGDVLKTASMEPAHHASPALLQAGMPADHIVSQFLEKAYRVLHESALAAAEASLQDAAANAGVHVQSLLRNDTLPTHAALGVPLGEPRPKYNGGADQVALEIHSSGSDISQPHESVNFGPRSAPSMRPEGCLIPDQGDYPQFRFNSQTQQEIQEFIINANL